MGFYVNGISTVIVRMQKTTATLNEVGDATGKAFTAFGSTVSTKFSEMK